MNFSNLPPEIISYHIATFLTNSEIAVLRLTTRYMRRALSLTWKQSLPLDDIENIESAYRQLGWDVPAVYRVYLLYPLCEYVESDKDKIYQIVFRLSPKHVDISKIHNFGREDIEAALQNMPPSVRVLTIPREMYDVPTELLLRIMICYPEIYLQDRKGEDLLYMFQFRGIKDAAFQLITGHRQDLNKIYTRGKRTLLEMAIFWREDYLANLLIDNGADVNFHHHSRKSNLILAVMNENVKLVRKLLARGADPDFVDFLGNTALDYAREKRSQEIEDILLKAMKQ